MAHASQFIFVSACAKLISNLIPAPNIVEVGSYDVNGSVRKCFPKASTYTGIDLVEGPGVDQVGSGHEFGLSHGYDIAISCECFEHNPYWLETFLNMIRIIKPGGFIIFTCATKGRPEHGTTRTDKLSNPGGISCGWDYYKNLSRNDFEEKIDLSMHFEIYEFFEVKNTCDLMFFGVKQGWRDNERNLGASEGIGTIEAMKQLRTAVHEIGRIKKSRDYPVLGRINDFMLYIAAELLDDRQYQNFRIKLKRFSYYVAGKFKDFKSV